MHTDWQGFEERVFGAIAVFAIAGALGFQLLTTPLVSEAKAVEPDRADYTMTVTAKRLPAICKTTPAAAACAQETRVEFHANR